MIGTTDPRAGERPPRLVAGGGTGDALAPGATLAGGRYRVGAVLGRGTFGITYAAADTRLARDVAVKELFPPGCERVDGRVWPSDDADLDEVRRRFVDEAAALARFAHPGIVRVYDLLEEAGTAYAVMELLRGRSLAAVLAERQGPLPWPEAVALARTLGEALDVVHQAGLLHRDVKPANVVLTDSGRIVLVDFGAARTFAAEHTSAMTQVLTPGYAPFEQYAGRARFGPPTDVYALGAMLYHLLTGRRPPSAADRLAGVALEPPSSVAPVPAGLDRAVLWAMALAPADRPPSAAAFVEALDPPPVAPAPNGTEATAATRPTPATTWTAATLVTPGTNGKAPTVVDRAADRPATTATPAPVVRPGPPPAGAHPTWVLPPPAPPPAPPNPTPAASPVTPRPPVTVSVPPGVVGAAVARRSLGPLPVLAGVFGAFVPVATTGLAVLVVVPLAAAVATSRRAARHRRARRGVRWWDGPTLAAGVAGGFVPAAVRSALAGLRSALLPLALVLAALGATRLAQPEGTTTTTGRVAQVVAGVGIALLVDRVARASGLGWAGQAPRGRPRGLVLALWVATAAGVLLALTLRLSLWPLPFGP